MIKPLADRIVVKPAEAEQKTSSGLFIPDNAKEKPMQGKVVAVGPGRKNDKGEVVAMEVKVGDVVLYGKYSGTEVTVDGENFLIVKESDRLTALVNEILTYSELQNADKLDDSTAVDLSSLVHSAVESFATLGKAEGITVETEIDNDVLVSGSRSHRSIVIWSAGHPIFAVKYSSSRNTPCRCPPTGCSFSRLKPSNSAGSFAYARSSRKAVRRSAISSPGMNRQNPGSKS